MLEGEVEMLEGDAYLATLSVATSVAYVANNVGLLHALAFRVRC